MSARLRQVAAEMHAKLDAGRSWQEVIDFAVRQQGVEVITATDGEWRLYDPRPRRRTTGAPQGVMFAGNG